MIRFFVAVLDTRGEWRLARPRAYACFAEALDAYKATDNARGVVLLRHGDGDAPPLKVLFVKGAAANNLTPTSLGIIRGGSLGAPGNHAAVWVVSAAAGQSGDKPATTGKTQREPGRKE